MLLLIFIIASVYSEQCFNSHFQSTGWCIPFKNCQIAKDLLKERIVPQHCKFEDEPFVCCPEKKEDTKARSTNYLKRKSEDYCDSIKSKEDKGGDLNEFLPYVREIKKEFSHMAALGYGTLHDIHWECGGTLINENFVLTAAHCLISQQHGPVKFVQLGTSVITLRLENIYLVIQTYVHENYKAPSSYNDVGLVELEESVKLSPNIQPACLHSRNTLPNHYPIQAIGWGKTQNLQKFSLHIFNQCNDTYAINRVLFQNGVIESQLCAGSFDGTDTCKGDSGGPLEYFEYQDNVHYVIGITSVGKSCGVPGVPGIYTRVYSYLEWIENIVWGHEFDIDLRISG